MLNVQIDEGTALDMLIYRVKYWTDDREIIALFEQYYEHALYSGMFDGGEFDVMSIVDNDYINNFTIIDKEEYNQARFEFLKKEIRNFIKENKSLYDADEHDDYVEALKDFIEDIKEEAPDFEAVEVGKNSLDFIDGYYIEAATDTLLLIS